MVVLKSVMFDGYQIYELHFEYLTKTYFHCIFILEKEI